MHIKERHLIKKLDILLVKSYIGPFIVTFFITLFVLVMQFFWLYMDELIGKGLGMFMILQLLALMAATLVPLALPLGVLLASIMTFGNMAESFELVAIKSSGISLNRFMRPLLVFIVFVSAFAFFFNNNVIPVANLKALSLLYDLRNSKPTLNIRAGQFNNDIDNYSIRIGEKDKDGKTIHDIIIYDQTAGISNTKVTIAKKGVMIPMPASKLLIFRLQDGWSYEEESDNRGKSSHNQTRMHFAQWDVVFDLSKFTVNRTNEDLFKNAYQMMNVWQLHVMIDSIERTMDKRISDDVNLYVYSYISLLSKEKQGNDLAKKIANVKQPLNAYPDHFLLLVPDSFKKNVLQSAMSNNRTMTEFVYTQASNRKLQVENLLKYKVEFHKKFTLSFACVLLFLIGAPLGAIIRKGGLGMPMIIAIGFFLVWYIISIAGEKLSKSGATPPYFGMWIAPLILMPLALVMLRQARNDSQIFTKEWYLRRWNGIKRLFVRKQN